MSRVYTIRQLQGMDFCGLLLIVGGFSLLIYLWTPTEADNKRAYDEGRNAHGQRMRFEDRPYLDKQRRMRFKTPDSEWLRGFVDAATENKNQ